MKRILPAVVLSVCVFSSSAVAIDYPKRKPGLWEIKMTMSGSPAMANMPAIQHCIDEKTDTAMQNMAQNASQGACPKNEVSKDGASYVIDTECTLNGSKMVGKSVFSGDFSAKYTGKISVKYDPPMMGIKESETLMEATYVGPCKADQKPGDMIMGNGMKVNMFDMAGHYQHKAPK